MAAHRQITVRSLRAFARRIEALQTTANRPLWFRGTGRAAYPLKPSLFRHPAKVAVHEISELERQLVQNFRQRSIVYGTRPLIDEWEVLFFMQHYGFPTRLLDWTESPFTAFFFAVMSTTKSRVGGAMVYAKNAAVWVLDPIAWNRHSLRHISFADGILSVGDDPLKGYTWRTNYTTMHNDPVCLFGIHNSQRIINQKGVFTVCGQGIAPMEVLYDNAAYPDDCLLKIVLPRSLIDDFRKKIVSWGITDSSVYPDLGGLALETKRFHGFEV